MKSHFRSPRLKLGAKFDSLTVETKDHVNRHGKIVFVCRCVCGQTVTKTQAGLAKMEKAGRHINCGCGPKNDPWKTRRQELLDMQGHAPVVVYEKPMPTVDVNLWSCYG
jgi:hypothetical protein